MPKIHNNYNDTVQYTTYDNESELPRNIKIFIRELRRELGDTLKLDVYTVTKSLVSPDDENYEPESDDLDLDYVVDAEEYATGKNPYGSSREIKNKFNHIAEALGIETWIAFPKIVNKKEFAEKFLKDLKKYMKSTDVGPYIHAIKFNVNNTWDLELQFVLKREFWERYNQVKEVAGNYLDSLGYNNVRIHVP